MKSVLHYAARFEELTLCILLLVMIFLACLQILLRNGFNSGLLWADPLLRYLVLWSGLLGAAMATSRGHHISLDLAGYLIPAKVQPLIKLICNLFSCITAGFLTWAAVLFIRSEIEFGSPALFGLHSWVWNSIFPIAFALITLRYLLQVVSSLIGLFTDQEDTKGQPV